MILGLDGCEEWGVEKGEEECDATQVEKKRKAKMGVRLTDIGRSRT